MHVLQVDSIHVVARSPYLVLWSRLGEYSPRWLDELLAERRLFESWSHAACFLPMEDYPLYRRLMLDRRIWNENRWGLWLQAHADLIDKMLRQIRKNGPVRSADFERTDGQKTGLFNWTDEQTVLEGLWFRGDLMVGKRHNFQRIYDRRQRILPDWDDAQTPSLETVYETFVLNTVKALGVTKAAWIADYFRMYKKITQPAIERLAKRGQIQTVDVEG